MSKKIKIVKGFVMNKKTGHPSLAFKQVRKDVDSVGFTHNNADKFPKEQLHKNINPDDCRDCFVKVDVEKQKYNDYRFKTEYNNYRIAEEDEALIKSIIDGSYFRNKNKKRR